MALVEFHQILLTSTDGKDARLLPVPVHPGPSLALVSLHRHFPNAVDLHYRPDLDTLVTLPKVCKGQQYECEGVVNFPTEGTFFILPFLDPSVTSAMQRSSAGVDWPTSASITAPNMSRAPSPASRALRS